MPQNHFNVSVAATNIKERAGNTEDEEERPDGEEAKVKEVG